MTDHRLEIVLAGKDASARVFKSVEGRIKKLTKSVLSLQGGLATMAGGYGLKMVAEGALNVASSFEMMEIKLNALTKGQGTETLAAINAWALEMPVNTRKAVDTFAMMQAMGLDPTIAKMETLVDTASIFGEEAMPRVARALGQMQTLGKLSAEELNQLAEAGINARKYITEAFGMTVEQVQKSGMEIERVVGAIWQGLARDFGGAAKEAQTSWRGLTATTRSYVEEIERRIMAAGVFDELKSQISDVNAEMKVWIDQNEDLIRQRVPEVIADIKEKLSTVWDIISYDPDIIKYGLVGLAVFGKKGGIILAGLAHTKNVIANTSKALGLAAGGVIEYKDLIGKSFKEIEALVNEYDEKFFITVKPRSGKSTGPKKTVPGAVAGGQAGKTSEWIDSDYLAGPWRTYIETLETVEQAQADTNEYLIEFSRRTSEAMEQNFSDLFFDMMTGEFKDLEDFAKGVFRSIQRAAADMLGQMAKEGLFGKEGMGGLIGKFVASYFAGGGGAYSWSSSSPAYSDFSMAGGGIIGEHVVGVGLQSGKSYEFGEAGAEVVSPVGAGQAVHNHYHIQALDAASFMQMCERNPQAIAAGLGVALERRVGGINNVIRSTT